MVGELGRIFHTARRRRDVGAAGRRARGGRSSPSRCVDARTAWVAGKEGIVLGTTDGGATWTPAHDRLDAPPLRARVPDTRQRGHGAGDFGTMVHTEDGGRTWTASRVPEHVRSPTRRSTAASSPGDVNLYALSYADADARLARGRVRHHPGERRRRPELAPAALARRDRRSSACTSPTAAAAGPSAPTASSCTPRTAARPGRPQPGGPSRAAALRRVRPRRHRLRHRRLGHRPALARRRRTWEPRAAADPARGALAPLRLARPTTRRASRSAPRASCSGSSAAGSSASPARRRPA